MLHFFDRLDKYMNFKGLNDNNVTVQAGLSNGIIGKARNRGSMSQDNISKILHAYSDLSADWLFTGIGTMLKNDAGESVTAENKGSKKLIPFYDDVSTVGGVNSITANDDCNLPVSEWIDAGDWFPEANAAIRHYGDSMSEYQSGCILALKKVEDKRLILWGRNYCIETTEFRVTKRLQRGDDKETLTAYSSNIATYPDGHLIHEPICIPKESVRRLYLVLGSVVKEYSSGAVSVKK